MMGVFHVAPEANRDLAEVWSYLAERAGEKVANRIIREIDERFKMLAQFPLAGRSRDEVRPGLRSSVVLKYVIFYRVAEHIVEIVRVSHGRQSLGTIFPE